jgi:E3 ubiquitin-protein ligase BIG BROTHER-like protein
MNVDLNSLNPDTMSYEQLLELGEKIGKVSKGLTKEEIEGLEHVKMKKKEENCPICCTELQTNEMGIRLRCKHLYHEECLMEWLKE